MMSLFVDVSVPCKTPMKPSLASAPVMSQFDLNFTSPLSVIDFKTVTVLIYERVEANLTDPSKFDLL